MGSQPDVTRDLEYLELEKRYKEIVAFADELRLETMAYRDHIANMLNHQFHCANYLAGVCGLVMEEEDPLDERVVRLPKREAEDIAPEMRQALEDYATAMAYCREESFSILDDLDALVVRPANRFHMITKTIDKTITKREHKLIDFDRHRIAYMKYSAISEPSPSEEKNMFKLQTQFDNAAADYDYFNNMLKDELVRFLDMSQEFIEPVFQQFYNIQSRIVGGFYSRIYEVIQHNGAVFPTLNMPIEDGFRSRLKEFNAREELDRSELFKDGIKPWQRGSTHSRYAKQQQPQRDAYYSEDEEDDEYLSTTQGYSMNRTLSNRSSSSSLGGGRRSSMTHTYNEQCSNDRLPAYSERRPSITERKTSVPDRKAPFVSDRPSYNDRRPSISDRKSSVSSYSSDRKPPLAEKPSFSDKRPSISERPSFANRRSSVSERPPISERPSINNPRQPPALSPRPSFTARNRSLSTSNAPPPIKSPSTHMLQSNYSNSNSNSRRQDGANGSIVKGLQLNLTEELNKTFSSTSSSTASSRVPSYRSELSPPTSTSTSSPSTPPATNDGYRRRNTVSSPFSDDAATQSVKKKRAPPPPPPSKKVANRKEIVEALYELNAPQDGDLSFHVGDLIEVLEKSDKTHDWWKGRLGDQTGMFPGKLSARVAQVIHD
ncbi:uncharacterized protein ATC70_007063 [Mucor velutinosus]|uniref:Uncharacterized protein n=1 Tax=Mucor velutinosus TaxID=708070 RepID=A0AAN7D332_9FUNG|nr:hypothetical protein ATC70_007063 [Mucor velutinosus]